MNEMTQSTAPALIIGRKYYDSILKELTYTGENKNEHTFRYVFVNARGNKIGLSDFELLALSTLIELN